MNSPNECKDAGRCWKANFRRACNGRKITRSISPGTNRQAKCRCRCYPHVNCTDWQRTVQGSSAMERRAMRPQVSWKTGGENMSCPICGNLQRDYENKLGEYLAARDRKSTRLN